MKILDTKRKLYLCCYDIACDTNRKQVHRIVNSFSSGGQKSAYECFLSPNELHLLRKLTALHIEACDSLVLQPITQSQDIHILGVGSKPMNLGFIFVG